uniref:Zinc finger AN1-type containing 3 n=1 Tax=Felis catus TaxID=9685 RepID=A0ABI7ZSH2_FELCA
AQPSGEGSVTERARPGASQPPLLRQSRRGPQVLPSAAARDIALAASGGGSCRGRRVFPPPPRSSVHPHAPPPQLPSLSAPPPAPPSLQAEWCGPPPADRPGIPARSLGLAPARAPAPSPSPRPEPPDAAAVVAAASFKRGPGPAAATAAAAELRRRRAPWETPGASAAKRPACRLAVPAASGDFQKKQPDDDSAPSTSNSQSDLFSEETTSDNNNTSITTPTLSPSQQPLPTELNVTSPSKEEYSQSENEASPVKRARLLENTERPEETSRSKQKSRRRCFQCQTKLELVQQELGSCRCGYVFCMLHRLPEQHDCTFDHMGRGREEAIMKMVKLDRKVGRSCQRIGEGCS